MTTPVRTFWHCIQALTSGLSLTLTLFSGVGIMAILLSHYSRVFPGGIERASRITQWFLDPPRHAHPLYLDFFLVLVGVTWLALQTKESALMLIQRVVLGGVTTGIFCCAAPFWNIDNRLIPPVSVPFSTYLQSALWLIPCAIPLVVALIKHRQSARNLPQDQAAR